MIEWVRASENEHGIKKIAFETIDKSGGVHRIIGYNGILKGDSVFYRGKPYMVVMVSRLGHMGLSENGELPYTLSVYPNSITKILDIFEEARLCDWCEDVLEEVYYMNKDSFTWSVCRDCLMDEIKD